MDWAAAAWNSPGVGFRADNNTSCTRGRVAQLMPVARELGGPPRDRGWYGRVNAFSLMRECSAASRGGVECFRESEINRPFFERLDPSRARLNSLHTSRECGMYGSLRAISYLHKRPNEMVRHPDGSLRHGSAQNQQTNSLFRWRGINKGSRPGPEGYNPMFAFYCAFLIRLKKCWGVG